MTFIPWYACSCNDKSFYNSYHEIERKMWQYHQFSLISILVFPIPWRILYLTFTTKYIKTIGISWSRRMKLRGIGNHRIENPSKNWFSSDQGKIKNATNSFLLYSFYVNYFRFISYLSNTNQIKACDKLKCSHEVFCLISSVFFLNNHWRIFIYPAMFGIIGTLFYSFLYKPDQVGKIQTWPNG